MRRLCRVTLVLAISMLTAVMAAADTAQDDWNNILRLAEAAKAAKTANRPLAEVSGQYRSAAEAALAYRSRWEKDPGTVNYLRATFVVAILFDSAGNTARATELFAECARHPKLRDAGAVWDGERLETLCGRRVASPPPSPTPPDVPPRPGPGPGGGGDTGTPTRTYRSIETSSNMKPMEIALLASLTGRAAQIGKSAVQGATLAREEIDRGKVVTLTIEDTSCEPPRAFAAAAKVIVEKKANIVLGDQCSPSTIAVAQVAGKYKTPLLVAGAEGDLGALSAEARRWTFRLWPAQAGRAKALHDYLVGQGVRRFVVVDNDTPFGRSFGSTIKQLTDAARDRAPAEEHYVNAQSPDVVEQVRSLVASLSPKGPDADQVTQRTAIVTSTPIVLEPLLIGLDQWSRRPRLGTVFAPPDTLTERYKERLEGAILALPWHPDMGKKASQDFVKAYEKQWKQPPDALAYWHWEAVRFAAAVLADVRSNEPERIREALERGQFEARVGLLKFDADHQATMRVGIARIEKGTSILVEERPVGAQPR